MNYDNVVAACNSHARFVMDNEGIALSKRKITLSTSGVVPLIRTVRERMLGIGLAISLHAVTNELARRNCSHQPQIPARTNSLKPAAPIPAAW